MMTPHLLIDCGSLLQTIKFSQMKKPGIFNYPEDNTIIAELFERMYGLSLRLNIHHFLFAWDCDSKTCLRRKKYPWYKDRHKVYEDMTAEQKRFEVRYKEQVEIIRRDVIPTIGFKHNHKYDGYEADDILAAAAIYNPGKHVMVTSDADMYQILPHADMWKITKNAIYDSFDFEKEYGVIPELWWKVKALAGCSSDTVPGIPNIGNITALKYLREDLPTTTVRYKAIVSEDGQKVYNRNTWLVKLPLEGYMDVPDLDVHDKNLSALGYNAIIDRYNLQELLPDDFHAKFKRQLRIR